MMKKNQKILWDALVNVNNCILSLAVTAYIFDKMTKEEVEEVCDKFNKEITDIGLDALRSDVYNIETNFEGIAIGIEEKLNNE